jgi:hypothetical protein
MSRSFSLATISPHKHGMSMSLLSKRQPGKSGFHGGEPCQKHGPIALTTM